MTFELKQNKTNKPTSSHLMTTTFKFFNVDMQLIKIQSKSLIKTFLLRMLRLHSNYYQPS